MFYRFWLRAPMLDRREVGGGGAGVSEAQRREAGEREAEAREEGKDDKFGKLVSAVAREVMKEIKTELQNNRSPERADALQAALREAGGDVRKLAFGVAEERVEQLANWERAVEELAKKTGGWLPAYRYENYYQATQRRKPLVHRGSIADRLMNGDAQPAIRTLNYFKALLDNNIPEARKWGARALAEGQLSAGGALVPEEFSQDVIAKLGELTPLATKEYLRILPMKSDTMRVPYLKTLPVAVYGTEGVAPSGQTEPDWGNLELVAREALMLVPVSEQMIQDASVEMIGYMTDLFAEALARLRNKKLLLGAGSNEPEGIVTNTGVSTNAYTTTDSGTKFRSILRCFHSVKAAYRTGAIWIMSDIAQETISGVLDTTNQPLLTMLMDEPFYRLRGKPVFITEALEAATPARAVFGNWKFYVFGDRMSMQARTDNGGKYFEARQVAVRVIERYDGKVAQPEAFNVMTGIQ